MEVFVFRTVFARQAAAKSDLMNGGIMGYYASHRFV
jgi:hypothetical protein